MEPYLYVFIHVFNVCAWLNSMYAICSAWGVFRRWSFFWSAFVYYFLIQHHTYIFQYCPKGHYKVSIRNPQKSRELLTFWILIKSKIFNMNPLKKISGRVPKIRLEERNSKHNQRIIFVHYTFINEFLSKAIYHKANLSKNHLTFWPTSKKNLCLQNF